jgi:hypothetical protein
MPSIDSSARELLALELAVRGRTWGSENPKRLAQMREEVSLLHHRPRLRGIMMSRHFNGRTSIGFGDGCYMRSKGSIDFARAQQGVD